MIGRNVPPSSAPSNTATTTPVAAAVDHALTRIEPPALSHGASPENALGSPEATRDQAVMDALAAFHDGEFSASQSCRF